MVYEFTFANGLVVFDWELGTIRVSAERGRKVGNEEHGPVKGEYPFEEDKVPAFLLAHDKKNKTSSAFLFNRPNLYAFLKMIKERGKRRRRGICKQNTCTIPEGKSP